MENKYYTPSIEEFHIGFEYEALDPVCNIWVKFIVNAEFEDVNPLWFPSVNKTRVKYLDREDIESLGFNNIIGDIYNLIDKNKGPFRLEYFENDNLLSIFYPEYYKNGEQLFKGTIKNKPELKVLLKQLNLY